MQIDLPEAEWRRIGEGASHTYSEPWAKSLYDSIQRVLPDLDGTDACMARDSAGPSFGFPSAYCALPKGHAEDRHRNGMQEWD